MSAADTVSPLFTDLYELTMASVYHAKGVADKATFSLFVRDSDKRNYYVAAGLEDAVSTLADYRFSDSDLAYLKETGLFEEPFLNHLKDFSFTGSVRAMAEGTVFFAGEPVMEVTAPIQQAQIAETFLLNTIGFQTMIASKAARCVHAAGGKSVVDFALRRTQGVDAGMKMARSAYIAGVDATSNTAAGKTWGIPVSGTMAHSYVSAFETETDAFRAYAETYPEKSIFLIDTYDTLKGAEAAVTVALEMKERGHAALGVRIDSGDMGPLSRQVREILDNAGLPEMKIFVSGGLDETRIRTLVETGAAIDAFGVGTYMGVSADMPSLDIVYKMVRFGNRNIRKLSPGKTTLAGEKQVYRTFDDQGKLAEDVIGTRGEDRPEAKRLLAPVMKAGRIVAELPDLPAVRKHFAEEFSALSDAYKSIKKKSPPPARISAALRALNPDAS